MTEEERREYAEELIRDHAQDVEFFTVLEMRDDEISDEDAGAVLSLIYRARFTVSWDA